MKRNIGIVVATLLAFSCGSAVGDSYPSKTVRVINQFGAGGGADLTARPILEKLQAALGRPVIMDNKPGGGGVIAATELEKADPDGHTLLIDTQTLSVNTVLRNVNYKHSEWEPIALFSLIPLALLASQDVPANNLNELIDYAKKDPGKVTYATLGPGTASHLAGLRFEQVTGTKLLPVPYKSTNDVHQDLLGKRVDLFFDGISQALPRAQAGTLKMLGVASTERLSIAADFPTIREQGVDLVSAAWFGLVAPKGTPKAITERLADEIYKITRSPDYQERLRKIGVLPMTLKAVDFAEFRRKDLALWSDVVKNSGLRID